MSKIEFEQINENEIEVIIPPETPMEMVQQLTKSFLAKGLVEDLRKSTLSVRYFYRPEDKANQLADQLIKSLEGMTKGDEELPYWHPKAQMANQKRVREMEIAERRAKLGIKPQTAPRPNVAPTATPSVPSPAATTAGSSPMTPAAYTASHPKLADSDPANLRTADGTGKRYINIKDPIQKEEDEDDVEKSNYGPKGAGLYNPADNARRKMKNTGDQTGFGSNVNTKQYTTAKYSNLTPQTDPKLKRPQPVKVFSEEEKRNYVPQTKMKKSWGEHLPFPSAEEEILRLAKATVQSGENAAANQLASLMMGKQMLGKDAHPVVQAMMAPPPPQPTDEQMFGHLAVSEEMAKAAENQWHNTVNNWLTEATKPISQRFASEEEELAYWSNIKVDDRDDGKSGY